MVDVSYIYIYIVCLPKGKIQASALGFEWRNFARMGITKDIASRKPHHAGVSVGLDKDGIRGNLGLSWGLAICKEHNNMGCIKIG